MQTSAIAGFEVYLFFKHCLKLVSAWRVSSRKMENHIMLFKAFAKTTKSTQVVAVVSNQSIHADGDTKMTLAAHPMSH